MNLEIKTKWLEELKSGEYIKTKFYLGRLRHDGQMCNCVNGVLAETLMKHYSDQIQIDKVCSDDYAFQYNALEAILDRDILSFCNLSEDHMYNLIDLNDSTEDFSDCIKYIEGEL